MSDEPTRIDRRALFGRLLPQVPDPGHWVKVHRTAMACRFEVTLDSRDAARVDAARAALDEVDAIEDALSWFRDTSEVSRVNRDAVTGPGRLSPGLFTLLSLCRELSRATAGAFDPAPGSPLYERAIAEGWPLPDSWSGCSQHSVDSLPLPTRHLSAGEVLRFRDEAFQTYFRSPDYLRHVERTFGPSVRDEIRKMSEHRHERRFRA